MSINNINNVNFNINNNQNNMSASDDVFSNQLFQASIQTWNGLFLIDDDDRVIQSRSSPLEPRRYWNIGSNAIINNRTGRYIGLREPRDENGIPLVTYSGQNDTTRWILDSVGPDQYMIENILTGRVFDVPENSSESGVNIIQYRRKVPLFENPKNQIFLFIIRR